MRRIKNQSNFVAGYEDVVASLNMYYLASLLGWQDVKQRYRRSVIGPFWLTISMGVMIGSIGLVFGNIFKSEMSAYLPFLSVGIVLWSYIVATIGDGANGFISAESIIKQLQMPLNVHILRVIWRNIIIMFHNLLILPVVYLIYPKPLGLDVLLFFPGLILIIANMAWIALVVAILTARYRDLSQIIGSILQVLYFLTPIVWVPHMLSAEASALMNFNPMFHLLEVGRAPLLGGAPSSLSWTVSIVMAIIGWLIALVILGRFRWRVVYWI